MTCFWKNLIIAEQICETEVDSSEDIYAGNVVLNMRMEGVAISDDTGKVLSLSGTPILSTEQIKYGTQSLKANGGYITTTSMGIAVNEDFTLELWVFPTSLYYNTALVEDVGLRSGLIFLDVGYLYWLGEDIETSGTLIANTWQHVAVSRASNTLKIFLNGSEVGSGTSTWALSLNTIFNDMYSQQFSGYFDDLRITKGVARYTSNFTPPTQIASLL